MNCYYSITDGSSAYHIAMGMLHGYYQLELLTQCSGAVLHPGLKLEYFRTHKWEDEWIDVAENLVREEYIDAYENRVQVACNNTSDKVGEYNIYYIYY